MRMHDFEQKYVRHIIGGLGAYEAAAIYSHGRIPTITGIIKWLYHQPAGRVALWGVWGWLTAHFFMPMVMEAVVGDD